MLISGKKTIYFVKTIFFFCKTKYKMCSVTPFIVISYVIAQLYVAVRKGVHLHFTIKATLF